MIKTIFWDFDGVIMDSMKIKGDGFKELFEKYDKKYLRLIEKHHYANGGVSRFDKIKYIYTEILKEDVSESEVLFSADRFASIIEKKIYNKDNLIEETIDYIKINCKTYNFHIVSGAEHNELNNLCEYFELTKYFSSIDGSPTKKDILVKKIIDKFYYERDEVILIGDAMTDYNAAIKNSIKFYGYNNLQLQKFDYIESFKGFKL